MTGSDPQRPSHQYQGFEYPSLENSRQDPYAPVDYPADVGLPPVYPTPPVPHPGWGYEPYRDPYGYPYRPPRPPGTNGMAIAALVTSVASVVMLCGITSFIGVIFGVIGMRQIRRTGQDGFGLALAGVIIGALPIVFWLIYLLVAIGVVASGWQWAQ